MIFKEAEEVLKKAREQDHVCEFCYYEAFDDRAYPCSRCVCNMPTENMWRPKPRVYGKKTDVIMIDESGGGFRAGGGTELF